VNIHQKRARAGERTDSTAILSEVCFSSGSDAPQHSRITRPSTPQPRTVTAPPSADGSQPAVGPGPASGPVPTVGSGPASGPGPTVGLWPEAAYTFPLEGLDDFLVWAAGAGASDITFQTDREVFIEVDGHLRPATNTRLAAHELGRIMTVLYGDSAESVLRSGNAIDCAYEVRPERTDRSRPDRSRRSDRLRFRVNISAVEVQGGFGANITLRSLPGTPPAFTGLGIEAEITEAWTTPRGLTLVTGVPGSGKSTLLAAGTRQMLEDGIGRIQSYEAPIEFVFDAVEQAGALMSASEVPRHFPTFAAGLRSSLRRRPAAVIVGEARDRETVEAAIHAADLGIAVFSTTHTVGVAQTVRRMLAEFPADEKVERGAALADLLNLVVTQCLVPNPNGGRTALREWLFFDEPLRFTLADTPIERWSAIIARQLAERGRTLADAAGRALEAGTISERDWRRLTPQNTDCGQNDDDQDAACGRGAPDSTGRPLAGQKSRDLSRAGGNRNNE